MSVKRNQQFGTKKDAEAAWRAASKISGILEIALRELVTGQVKWLDGEAPRRIGLCQLGKSHGGVVILVEQSMIGARLLEEWLEDVQSMPAPNCRDYMPNYRAWLDIRQLAAQAVNEMTKANERAAEEAKGCQRIAPPGEVDQNIRTY